MTGPGGRVGCSEAAEPADKAMHRSAMETFLRSMSHWSCVEGRSIVDDAEGAVDCFAALEGEAFAAYLSRPVVDRRHASA